MQIFEKRVFDFFVRGVNFCFDVRLRFFLSKKLPNFQPFNSFCKDFFQNKQFFDEQLFNKKFLGEQFFGADFFRKCRAEFVFFREGRVRDGNFHRQSAFFQKPKPKIADGKHHKNYDRHHCY